MIFLFVFLSPTDLWPRVLYAVLRTPHKAKNVNVHTFCLIYQKRFSNVFSFRAFSLFDMFVRIRKKKIQCKIIWTEKILKYIFKIYFFHLFLHFRTSVWIKIWHDYCGDMYVCVCAHTHAYVCVCVKYNSYANYQYAL